MFKSVDCWSEESEQSLIGCLLYSNEKIDDMSFLKALDFISKQCGDFFEIIRSRRENNQETDPILLVEEYRGMREEVSVSDEIDLSFRNKVAGDVASMVADCFSSENAIEYAKLIKEFSIKRQLKIAVYGSFSDIKTSAWSSEGIISELEKKIDECKEQTFSEALRCSVKDTIGGFLEDIVSKSDEPRGVPTGYWDLDEILGGLKPGKMIVLAARPGVGKSTLAQNICVNVAKMGTPVAFFSLEMVSDELMLKMLSAESKIYLDTIEKQGLNDKDFQAQNEAAHVLSSIEYSNFCVPSVSVAEVRMNIKEYNRELAKEKKKPVGLIVLDYLQLMRPSDGGGKRTRENDVSAISSEIKGLTLELNVPIIVLCQLNRDVEKRPDNTPRLYDLRESGSIEQDADVVLLMHRPDAGKFLTGELSKRDSSETILQIAKSRVGRVGKVSLNGFLSRSKFENITEIGNE